MEGGIRVPFIVTGPKIKARSQCEIPISFSDLLPTIIDLAAGEKLINKKLDGGSFKEILLNKSKKIKRNFNGIVFHVPYENKIALSRAHSAIIVDKMKFIKFYDNNETRLFNLKYLLIIIKNNTIMGQYFKVVNKTKKEYLSPYTFGNGAKMWEIVASGKGVLQGLGLLLAEGHYIDGDETPTHKSLIGRWVGDSITMVGDYAKCELYHKTTDIPSS